MSRALFAHRRLRGRKKNPRSRPGDPDVVRSNMCARRRAADSIHVANGVQAALESESSARDETARGRARNDQPKNALPIGSEWDE